MIEEARGLGLRQGPWKFIRPRGKRVEAQLYNLDADVSEQNNLIATEKERAAQMQALLEQLIADAKGIRQRG